MTFQDFGFDERILKGIADAGFEDPMPVQVETFNLLLKEKRDVYGQSQTGTGKTAAFLLGIYQILLTDEAHRGQKALIVVPTRELAVQIEKEAKLLGHHTGLKSGSVFGGVGYGQQERMLSQGVDILIGTPGRLIDFNRSKKINFQDFGFLVIDEADRLFDMGFLPDLRKIFKKMKSHTERRTMLFSATLTPRVGTLAWEYMNDPGEVIIDPEKVTVDTVSQELYHVGKNEKLSLLLGILRRDDPENAIIFTNTRHAAWEVAKRLEENGYSVEFLMGDLPQSKRLKIVEEIKKNKIRFLVATDVAARGLHIDALSMVINFDVPLDAEGYVHRIGRTARVGREGKTVTLACEEYVYGLAPIEKLLGYKIPVSWADETLMVADKSLGKRYLPRQRYKELGIERTTRQGDPLRRTVDRSYGSGSRRPSSPRSGARRPLDPQTAQVQAGVAKAAGVSSSGGLSSSKSSPSRQGRENPRGGNIASAEKPRKKAPQRTTAAKPRRKEKVRENDGSGSRGDMEERLDYYRTKYGEDFRLKGEFPLDSAEGSPSSQDEKTPRTPQRKKGRLMGRLFRGKNND